MREEREGVTGIMLAAKILFLVNQMAKKCDI